MSLHQLSRRFFFVLAVVNYSLTSTKAQAQKQAQAKPWLGISMEKGVEGVLVQGVIKDTPAESAGILAGDEVLKIDRDVIKDPRQLFAKIQECGIGQTVTLELLRGKEKITKTLKLVMRPDELKIIRDKLVGKPAPEFKLDLVHGKSPASTSALKGQVVVLEFWATWCPACRSSHPRLSEFAKKHPEITVLAISDEDVADLKKYAKLTNPSFSIARDPKNQIQAQWNAHAIPMLTVLDKNGLVSYIDIGAGENLELTLNQALKLASPLK